MISFVKPRVSDSSHVLHIYLSLVGIRHCGDVFIRDSGALDNTTAEIRYTGIHRFAARLLVTVETDCVLSRAYKIRAYSQKSSSLQSEVMSEANDSPRLLGN